MSGPRDVVVVGSGPNGLAAVTLARAGLSVTVLEAQPTAGGGVRTLPLVGDRVGQAEGLLRDVCAAVPAAAPTAPFFAAFDLPAHGVELVVPEASYAQPLDDGRAAVAWRDVERTAGGLGRDGDRWRSLVGPLVREAEGVARIALSDKRSVPREAVTTGAGVAFARALAVLSSPAGDRWWRTAEAPALITGVAAHAITRLPSPAAAGAAAYLGALAHTPTGWPLVRGGIGEITRALVEDLLEHGGELVTGHPVRSAADLPWARHTPAGHPRARGGRAAGRALPEPTARDPGRRGGLQDRLRPLRAGAVGAPRRGARRDRPRGRDGRADAAGRGRGGGRPARRSADGAGQRPGGARPGQARPVRAAPAVGLRARAARLGARRAPGGRAAARALRAGLPRPGRRRGGDPGLGDGAAQRVPGRRGHLRRAGLAVADVARPTRGRTRMPSRPVCGCARGRCRPGRACTGWAATTRRGACSAAWAGRCPISPRAGRSTSSWGDTAGRCGGSPGGDVQRAGCRRPCTRPAGDGACVRRCGPPRRVGRRRRRPARSRRGARYRRPWSPPAAR